jgi:hypothetical protein
MLDLTMSIMYPYDIMELIESFSKVLDKEYYKTGAVNVFAKCDVQMNN